MAIKRTTHAVYDLESHFVWIPKYRKNILTRELKKGMEELFREIAGQYDFEMKTMGIEADPIHIVLQYRPSILRRRL